MDSSQWDGGGGARCTVRHSSGAMEEDNGARKMRSIADKPSLSISRLHFPPSAWSIFALKSDWPLPSWESARERSGLTQLNKMILAMPTREPTLESSSRMVKSFENQLLDILEPVLVKQMLPRERVVTLVPVRERVATKLECPQRSCG